MPSPGEEARNRAHVENSAHIAAPKASNKHFADYVHASRDDFRWRLYLRGSLLLRDPDGLSCRLRGRKTRAIVGYLAVHADQGIVRDRLIELLWSDRSESCARGSLRQCVLEIRKAAPGLMRSDNGNVWIESNRITWERPPSTSRSSQLFDDLDDISPQFDQWLRYQRAKEVGLEWAELERNVEDILSGATGGRALPLIERMHRIDPYSEDWVRLAMRVECQLGHPAGIVRCFSGFADCLRRELGVLPATTTRQLHDRLLFELTVKEAEPNCCGPDPADPRRVAQFCGMG